MDLRYSKYLDFVSPFLVGGPDSTPDLFCPSAVRFLSGLEKNWVQGYLIRVGQTKPLPRHYWQCFGWASPQVILLRGRRLDWHLELAI